MSSSLHITGRVENGLGVPPQPRSKASSQRPKRLEAIAHSEGEAHRLDAESLVEGAGAETEDELERAGAGAGAPQPDLRGHPEQVPAEAGEVGVEHVAEGHRGHPVEEG